MTKKLRFKETFMKLGGKKTRVLVPLTKLTDEEAWKMMRPIIREMIRNEKRR